MANRYWVGGSGDWNDTAFWAEETGGLGGFSVPTLDDDVFIDGNSDIGSNFTITFSSAIEVRDFIISGLDRTLILAISSNSLNVHGSLNIPSSGVSITGANSIFFYGSGTHTVSNILSFGSYLFLGTGTYTLTSNVTLTGSLNVGAGTFNTNNFNINCDTFNMYASSAARTVNLGSSTITCSGSYPLSSSSTITGLTFNAGTSTFLFTYSSTLYIHLYASTFYNITVGRNSNQEVYFDGGNVSYNNLTVNGPVAAGSVRRVLFRNGTNTINGTLTLTGGSANTRIWLTNGELSGNTSPTARTITAAAVNITDVDFSYITGAGAAAPWTGTRLGNATNNSGITFDTPKTVYWNLSGSQNWNAAGWATSSGGVPNANNYPLPQDTAVIDDAGAAGTITINTGQLHLPTIDFSSRTASCNLSMGSTQYIHGNFILSSAVTVSSSSGTLYFVGSSAQTINTLNKSLFSRTIYITNSSNVGLASSFTNTGSFYVTRGTFNTSNYAMTTNRFELGAVTSLTGTVNLGSSTITAPTVEIGNGTFSAGTSTIILNASNSSISGTDRTFNIVIFSDTSLMANEKTISGSNNIFAQLTVNTTPTGYTKLKISNSNTIANLITQGGSYTGRIFIYSRNETENPTNISTTLTVTTATVSYTDFRNINITGGAAPLTGTSLGDAGSNNGITFDTPKTVYYVPSGGTDIWTGSTVWSNSSGGTTNSQYYPLPQDTVVINNANASSGDILNLTSATLIVPNIDTTLRTTPLTINYTTAFPINILKSLIFSNAITFTSVSNSSFAFYSFGNSHNIRSNNQPLPQIIINGIGNTVTLLDNLTLRNTSQGDRELRLIGGAFDANDFNITAGRFDSNYSNTRTISMGSGIWTLSNAGTSTSNMPFILNTTVLTLNRETAEVYFTSNSEKEIQITGSGINLPTLVQAGRGTLQIDSSGNSIANIKNTVAQNTISFVRYGTTTIEKFEVAGFDSEYVTITDNGSITLNYTGANEISTDFVIVQNTTVTPSGFWIAGVNSFDGGGNTGWIFLTPPNPSYYVTSAIEEVPFERRYTQYREIGQKSSRLTSGKLYGWGSNGFGGGITGAVGDGFSSNNGSESRSSPVQIGTDFDWRYVCTNGSVSFGIRKDATLFSWGSGLFGALGDGTTISKSLPVQVCGNNTWLKAVGSGGAISAALDTNKKLWTWGLNQNGALGTNDSSLTSRCEPGRICDNDSDWKDLTGKRDGFIGIKSDGTLWGWGWNGNGAVGSGVGCTVIANYSSPVQEASLSNNWCMLESNQNENTLAIKTDGTLWSWGCAAKGALGHNLSETCHRSSPGEISGGGNSWCTASMGTDHGAAIKTNGTIWVWGDNSEGQLGLGAATNLAVSYSSPIQEGTSSTEWCMISSGIRSNRALKVNGTMWAWGDGFQGTLANNNIVGVSSPVQEITCSTKWRSVSGRGFTNHGIQYD